MNKSSITILILLLVFASTNMLVAQLTPQEAVPKIMKGINLGNTLEPPTEGEWNNGSAKEYYFDDYKSAGFNIIRIPVRWDKHTQTIAPFTITDSWMDRVEEVVDWGLSRGLFIILNAHHDDWIKQDYSEANKERLDSIWSQICVRLKNKSENLFFEMFNEPNGLTVAQVDDMNTRLLSIIRKTNPTRIVIYSGNKYSGLAQMMGAKKPNDQYIMAYYHSYDPWNFAGLGSGTWGSSANINQIRNDFQTAGNWSTTNNIPVMISEFGAVHKCDYNSRMLHYATYVEEATKNNIPFMVWDDGGDFGVYNRSSRTWPEVKDILLHSSVSGANGLKIKLHNESLVTIDWNNRASQMLNNLIERKVNNNQFDSLAILDDTTNSFTDTTISKNNTYYYRIKTIIDDTTFYYSYPIKAHVKPTERSSYLGAPFNVPCIIEAENFDVGGEGLTYHDTEVSNIPGAYRTNEGVDIETRTSGGFHLAYTESGEWVEYTLNVQEAGEYDITTHVASLEGGGKIRFSVENTNSEIIDIPSTSSWQTTNTVTGNVTLQEGEQILRLSIVLSQPFNVDKFEISKVVTSVSDESHLTNKFQLNQNYPNPFNPTTTIKYSVAANGRQNNAFVQIRVFDILGKEVADLVKQNQKPGYYEITFDASNLTSGIYYYQLVSGDFVSTKKMLLIK